MVWIHSDGERCKEIGIFNLRDGDSVSRLCLPVIFVFLVRDDQGRSRQQASHFVHSTHRTNHVQQIGEASQRVGPNVRIPEIRPSAES